MTATASPTTSTALNPNLRIALEWAALGVAVLPVCGPNEDHECGCPNRREPHTGKDVGKAPLWEKGTLEHGVDDATTDARQLRAWWTTYPNANVAIGLASADLFAVDNDSAQAEAESVARGLPPAPRRVSGHGNLYLYKRPKDCPIYRPTHKGESKSIDLLTGGYAIVYGTHASGADIYCEPVELPTEYAPSWAVELLKAAATQKGADIDLEIDDEEPPVPLYGEALRRWKGELPCTDRSLYLFDIGCDLARAGMTANGIVQALGDRDRHLEMHKYSDRRDGGKTEYARIAGRALERAASKAREPRLAIGAPPKPPPGDETAPPDPKLIAQLRAENEWLRAQNVAKDQRIRALEAENTTLRELQRFSNSILGHPDLSKTEAAVLIHTAIIVDNERTRDDGRRLDEAGRATVWRPELAERTGVSESTITSTLKKLKARGLLIKDTVNVPKDIDPVTGVIHDGHREIRVALPAPTLRDYYGQVLNYRAEEPSSHGGARVPQPACEEHPEAGVIIRTETHCAHPGCAVLLDGPRERYRPAEPKNASRDNGPAEGASSGTFLDDASRDNGPPAPTAPQFDWLHPERHFENDEFVEQPNDLRAAWERFYGPGSLARGEDA